MFKHPRYKGEDTVYTRLYQNSEIPDSREVCLAELQKEMDILQSWVLVFKIFKFILN